MTDAPESSETAFRVADGLRGRLSDPWELFGENLRRYEIHFVGDHVELTRGPLQVEGFGLRIFSKSGDGLGVGFAATTDLSAGGTQSMVEAAKSTTVHAQFPSPGVDLPSSATPEDPTIEMLDPDLVEIPSEMLEEFVRTLFETFGARRSVHPTFGSVRTTLSEAAIANSAGLRQRSAQTSVEFELAVKTGAGPRGTSPAEYWINRSARKLDPDSLATQVAKWCDLAVDAQQAVPTPGGAQTVVFPPEVMEEVIPTIVGFRFSGAARLRKIEVPAGTRVASPSITITNDARFPGSLGSYACDDEGVPSSRHTLIEAGVGREPLYDLLHGSAFQAKSTGNGRRVRPIEADWRRFYYAPAPFPSTTVVAPGSGGSDSELVEAVGEGLWIDQLAWAHPDPVSGAFGGEIRIGHRIRNGKIAEPVRGGIVGGVLFSPTDQASIFGSVSALGGRPRLTGILYAPTIAAAGVAVAGPA